MQKLHAAIAHETTSKIVKYYIIAQQLHAIISHETTTLLLRGRLPQTKAGRVPAAVI